MDILDNLIYASCQSPLQVPFRAQPQGTQMDITALPNNAARIISDYVPAFHTPPAPTATGGSYTFADKMNFCAYDDPAVIEHTVTRHWYDIDRRVNYNTGGISQSGASPAGTLLSSFESSSTYHLMTSYLLENTRILQIFERFLEKYLTDEEFGITSDNRVFNWINNSEQLFFKRDIQVRSIIRPGPESVRRNAYWRMFGIDLAFGDINSQSSAGTYVKAKKYNQQFIPLFEKYLGGIRQALTNAANTSGGNTGDINMMVDLAEQIRELLVARRGGTLAATYASQNLSREEFSAAFITTWFSFIVSDNTPVVQFLNCQADTMGERLIKIGNKVGIPAHSKCQSMFDMAGAVNAILISIEAGSILNNHLAMQDILSVLNPNPAVVPDPVYAGYVNNFLTIINNWEKATGRNF